MRIRSAKPLAPSLVLVFRHTQAHPLWRGDQARAAPLIVPPHFDDALRKRLASTPEKSLPSKKPSRKPSRPAKLL